MEKMYFLRKNSREKKKTRFLDDSNSEVTIHNGGSKMRFYFYFIAYTLHSTLCGRKEAYSDINKNFNFLIGLKNLDTISLC